MTYEWEFTLGGRPLEPVGRRCHRGPMIDIEIAMSQPFTVVSGVESLRKLLLEHVVSSSFVAVRTRECILRVLNSNIGPLFVSVNPRYGDLKTLICEKRNSIVIDQTLAAYDFQFEAALRGLEIYGVNKSNIDVLLDSLKSTSPIVRVAARCGLILAATLVEMR